MAIYIPNDAEQRLLKLMLAGGAQEDFLVKLFSDNVSFSPSDVASSRTETDFIGYSNTANGTANKITRSDWAAATYSGGQPSYVSLGKQIIFTSTASNQTKSVYGYYVVGVSGVLYWQERFPAAPYVIANTGDSIAIQLKFGLE